MAAESRSGGSRKKNSRKTSERDRRYQDVLKVTVRSSQQSREFQRRAFRLLSKVLIVACLGTALYFGISKATAWLILKNPEYNVADLNVETDGVLEPETVLQTADLHKGGNIFLVNLSRAQSKIQTIPLVEKVQVSRQLPSRINVQISERKPVAWIAPAHGAASREEVVASPQSFLIDANLIVLQPRKLSPQDQYLPIIRNYSGNPLVEGQEADGEEIKAALELLRAHQESLVAARFQIQEIDLARHYALTVSDRTGMQVMFGLEDLDRQLKRLDSYLQFTDQHGEQIQTINLLAQKNVPVTYRVAALSVDKPAEPVPSPALSLPAAKSTAVSGKDKSGDRDGKTSGKEKKTPQGEKKHEDKPREKPAATTGTHRERATQPFLVTPAGVN